MILDVNETFIRPVFEHLVNGLVRLLQLCTIERYVRVIEWFDREELAKSFEADTAAEERKFTIGI